jgi:serine/threonine protein phosphatase PrpC
MPLTLRYVTHSEIGLVRKNNQDSGYASPHLLVVADGMGGAAAGDLASAVAIQTIRQVDAPTPAPQMLDVLARAVHQANDRIADLVEADVALDGMGTTVTGALFDGDELGLVHIGDSRAYLFRDGRLERLTHDHSWVQSLVDDGKIDEAEASVHPHRSLLLKVLNGQPANEPDLTRLPVQAGDRLLFCSDGLCGLVDDPTIAEAMTAPELERVLADLVAEARAEGGIDNITVILADVVEAGGTDGAVVLGAAADHPAAPVPAPAAADPTSSGPADPGSGRTAGGATALGGTALGAAGGGAGGGAAPVPHEDEARYNPQPPRQRRLVRTLASVLVLVLVAAAGLGAAYAWTRTQFYVGAAGEQVAIFQGLPERVVVPLSRVYEVQEVPLASLPPFYADQVRAGIEVSSLDSARQTVAELTEASKRCTGTRATPAPSPRPTGGTAPAASAAPTPPAMSASPSGSATSGPSC